MNILIDTNIVLDVLLERPPWLVEAEQIWDACDTGKITGYLAATSVTNIHYIARRMRDLRHAQIAVGLCLGTFRIAPIDDMTLVHATSLPGADFEDNLQIASALIANLDAIVTRDPPGFANAPLPILRPHELLARIAQNRAL
jgi:predicted nucleic acid-binding protein